MAKEMKIGELEDLMMEEPEQWELMTNSQDIADVILGWKLGKSVELVDVGCLFIKYNTHMNDIDEVWYSESNVPYHHKMAYKLL